jgi:hypothetical protein
VKKAKDAYTKGSADRKTKDESFKLEKNCSAIWDPTFKSLEVYDDTKDILIKRIGSNVTSKEDAMQKAKRIIDNYKPASSLTKEQKLNRSGYYTANDALPYEKNGRNLMEWENGDLSLEELKRKLAVAVEERDEYAANAVRQDIQRRQKTQDAFTKEQIKSYMDQLYKTPKDNLIQEYKRVTKVSTPEGNSKDVLISGLLEAKFGKGYDKILFANDKFTGDPLTKKGNKILAAMRERYGKKKGKSVFYASKNKGTIAGVDGKTKDGEYNVLKGKLDKIKREIERYEKAGQENSPEYKDLKKQEAKLGYDLMAYINRPKDSKSKDQAPI